MASLTDAQTQAYQLANPAIAFNPNAAIAKKWLALKAAGTFIGVPIGPEIQIDGGGAAQAFTSGVILQWTGGNNVDII